jgi:hypothetical protein
MEFVFLVSFFRLFGYGKIVPFFVFSWRRLTAVRSGKSVDNSCAQPWELLDVCGRTVQENDLGRVGLRSCTLLNASCLRRLLSSFDRRHILRHGFVIQIWTSGMKLVHDIPLLANLVEGLIISQHTYVMNVSELD